jgi:hypothetical protein
MSSTPEIGASGLRQPRKFNVAPSRNRRQDPLCLMGAAAALGP